MRRRRTRISVLLSVLLLVLVVPTASAGAARTDFFGYVFPAGYSTSGRPASPGGNLATDFCRPASWKRARRGRSEEGER